jgi:DNA-binding NarL/FixJ family response regulator
MIRVLLAAPQPDVRAALRLLLLDLSMELVGEAPDWPTILALTPEVQPDMLLVDWDFLISQLAARQQAALSAGADAFISKGEMPDRVADRLRAAAELVLYS